MSKPVQTTADFGSVEGLVGRLQTAQMKSIVADNADARRPEEVRPRQAGGDGHARASAARSATLLLGGKADGRHGLRARRVEADRSSPSRARCRRPEEGRRRLPAQGRLRVPPVQRDPHRDSRATARRWRSTRSKAPRTPQRRRTNGARQPDGRRRRQGEDGRSARRKLSNMRATSFVDSTAKTGLDKPAMTVVVKFDDGKKEERVTFGQNGQRRLRVACPASPARRRSTRPTSTKSIKALDELSK